MSTPVTISSAVINYTAGTTDCQCSIEVVVLSIGTTYVGTQVSLVSADLPPDWTDAQLCAAVAAKLNVPVEDVSVAVPPSPPPVVLADVHSEALAAEEVQDVGPETPADA